MTFTERIGGVLVAPRQTFAKLARGAARPSDVAWLLLLRLVAGELDRFAHAIAVGREFGGGAALQEILTVSTTVLPDVIAILAAGMLLQLLSRAKNAFDVAGYAWIPYLAVQLAGALYFTARRYPPSPRALSILEAVGVAWALAVLVVAVVETRKLEVPA
jgi:Yip1-like protein